jgi:hypothetical protein
MDEVIWAKPLVLHKSPKGFRIGHDLAMPDRNPPTAVLLDVLWE